MTREKALEAIRDLLSPAELAVTLVLLGLALGLVVLLAVYLYSTYNGIPVQ